MSVWWGGRSRDDDDVPLAVDRGLLLGDGLFETILVLGGAAPLLDRHLARLAASARRLSIEMPTALDATIARALPALYDHEGRPQRGALRITVTRGRGRGLTPPLGPPGLVLCLGALPGVAPGLPAPPVVACIVDSPRIDPHDPLAGHKVLSYMGRVAARRAAIDLGADVALLTTLGGDVCEADAANLFIVSDGVVVTPPLDTGVLPGITRARSIESLRHAGARVLERRIARTEIDPASEVFLTSSLDGVRPVSFVGARSFAAPGPLALWLAGCISLGADRTEEVMLPAGIRRAE